MINRSKEKLQQSIEHFRHKALEGSCDSAELNFEALLEVHANQRQLKKKLTELEERIEGLE